MNMSCKDVAERIELDLSKDCVPADSIAEKILWFDKFWKLQGYTFGVSSNGVPMSNNVVGDAEGLKNKTVFVCDTHSGECQELKLVTRDNVKARPAPREYLELLDRYPEALTDFKFRFVSMNIAAMDSHIYVNAYSNVSLDFIARMTDCRREESPRVLVDRLHWWGISKDRYEYGHYTCEDFLMGVVRPLDQCGQCQQRKRLRKCTACNFNLLCRSCKCEHCDTLRGVYEKMSRTQPVTTICRGDDVSDETC